MATDPPTAGRNPGKHSSGGGFRWVSSSPTPTEVERLERIFPDVVSLPVRDIEEELMMWKQRAAILRSFHRWIPAEAYIREFRRAGITGPITPISLAFRCHVFCFESAEVCSAVLDRPWVINGQTIGAEEWRPEFSPASDSIPSALVWIRLPNLPLEFWKLDFLRSIVAPAGIFHSVDEATLAKSRGGYARVCIRVDLRLPLRPGVRIQGINCPFWQQMTYESLDGVCFHCGSMHLGGPCVVSSGAEESMPESAPEFGPWLVASRQWKPATAPHHPPKGKATPAARSKASAGPSSPSTEQRLSESAMGRSPDGWVTPARVSRRKTLMATVKEKEQVISSPELAQPVMKSAKNRASVLLLQRAGPSLATVPAEKDSEHSVIRQSINPFALLAASDVGIALTAVRDACPGPLKRARPEDSLIPRSKLSLGSRKGKSKGLMPKTGGKALFSPNQQDLIPGDQDTDRCAHPPKAGLDGGSKDPGLSSGSSAQYPSSADSEIGQSSLMIEEGALMSGGISDSVMVDDQGGGPCPLQPVK